ncbi:MAG: hypothetical protein ACRDTM_06320 [Micromonosporaceae bacterium]
MFWNGVLRGVIAALTVIGIGFVAVQSAGAEVGPAASGEVGAAAGSVNNNPAYLQVYANNVENLETVNAYCPGDWQDLVYYMKGYETSPDLFLVQQVANRAELNTLVSAMTDRLAGVYAGVLAVSQPERMNSPCGSEKAYQTNAIIYRTGRFNLVSTSTWQSDAQTSSGGCANNSQDRTINLRARLWDKIAGKYVTAASIHWPTSAMDGPPCASENAREAAAAVSASGGSLLIWGGDANITDQSSGSWRSWYTRANGDLGGSLGYRDALYDHCRESSSNVKSCLLDNWTISGSRRIDFLFARKGSGGMPFTGAEHTVTFNEGDAADIEFTGNDRTDRDYSDHRAVRARIHY